MNKAESTAIEIELRERGWERVGEDGDPDLVLINTCSVRKTAENRAFGRLGLWSSRKRQGRPLLVVLGCMAERLKDGLKKDCPAVDHVLGPTMRSTLPLILDAQERGVGVMTVEESPRYVFGALHHEPGAFKAFIPIMHGCDNFCAYCVVPYVRGRELSRSPESILAEMAELEDRGVREVSLLGQNVNSYRYQEGGSTIDFPGLLRLVASKHPGIRWIRFLSSHPKDMSDSTIEALASSPRFARHIHLCAQHGSDAVLEAMNRRSTRAGYLALVAKLRQALPGLSLSTDLMVGFPGESEDDFEELLSLVEEVRFEYAFMYRYNKREGTAAAAMPNQVPEAVKSRRLSRLIELQSAITKERLLSRVGGLADVLVEGTSRRRADELLARTEQDSMVVFKGPASLIGNFAQVRLESLKGNTFRARLIDD